MKAKQVAATQAVNFVKDNMTVGIGTGSTAAFAIEALSQKIKAGMSIKAVASSLRSEKLAKEAGIPLIPFSEVETIHIYIDGADEVDLCFNLIKGGGGALLREKILAFHSQQFMVIVDGSKLVQHLGKFPLPVEVTQFAWELTFHQLQTLGCTPQLRKREGQTFITDNGNFIIDCFFQKIENVKQLHDAIGNIPGVVENGLFLYTMVDRIIVGYESGQTNEFINEQ